MFESIASETKTGSIHLTTPELKGPRESIEAQIGVLKEVALSLLQQLDLLRTGPPREQTLGRRSLSEEVRDFEINLINSALARTHGHQRRAAHLLGLKVTTLNAKIKRYKIMSRFYMPIGRTPAKN